MNNDDIGESGLGLNRYSPESDGGEQDTSKAEQRQEETPKEEHQQAIWEVTLPAIKTPKTLLSILDTDKMEVNKQMVWGPTMASLLTKTIQMLLQTIVTLPSQTTER